MASFADEAPPPRTTVGTRPPSTLSPLHPSATLCFATHKARLTFTPLDARPTPRWNAFHARLCTHASSFPSVNTCRLKCRLTPPPKGTGSPSHFIHSIAAACDALPATLSRYKGAFRAAELQPPPPAEAGVTWFPTVESCVLDSPTAR